MLPASLLVTLWLVICCKIWLGGLQVACVRLFCCLCRNLLQSLALKGSRLHACGCVVVALFVAIYLYPECGLEELQVGCCFGFCAGPHFVATYLQKLAVQGSHAFALCVGNPFCCSVLLATLRDVICLRNLTLKGSSLHAFGCFSIFLSEFICKTRGAANVVARCKYGSWAFFQRLFLGPTIRPEMVEHRRPELQNQF